MPPRLSFQHGYFFHDFFNCVKDAIMTILYVGKVCIIDAACLMDAAGKLIQIVACISE